MLEGNEPRDLEDRVALLERQLASLSDDPSVGSVLRPGKFTLKYPTRIQGPDGAAYILVREQGGNLALKPANEVSPDDWTDA